MATINFYLDKADKKGFAPIHLRVNCNGKQVKISTGEKIEPQYFDKHLQIIVSENDESKRVNHYLSFLKDRANELLNKSTRKTFLLKEIKEKLSNIIESYKAENHTSLVKEQLPLYGKSFTFLDLFAGAGGFSEGFLQAESNNKFFDFVLASDINENCELTHVVRYNHQLGLNTKFLKQDVTEPDFLENLLKELNGQTIDVVCGGPPCQSFSLAGRRRKFDKKDDLFKHYLEVIKVLQPKYFIMENVKGILTKEKGAIQAFILQSINSIVDTKELVTLSSFVKKLRKERLDISFLFEVYLSRIAFEKSNGNELAEAKTQFIALLDRTFKKLTPKIFDYKTSKTNIHINTIRHGLNLLARNKELEILKRSIVKEKDLSNIDNDYFSEHFNNFIATISDETIINNIQLAFDNLNIPSTFQSDIDDFLKALDIYTQPFDETLKNIETNANELGLEDEFKAISEKLRLYQIEAPFVANASNYGVPQNRERVLFIGCRKDQKMIQTIPSTVTEAEKVGVFEALWDLDFLGNDDEAHHYEKVDIKTMYNGSSQKMKELLEKRSIDGKADSNGKTYSEWSKKGRLNHRHQVNPPFYVRNESDLIEGIKIYDKLLNHKTSKQSKMVLKRLKIILEAGDYQQAKQKLSECGVRSEKRNYTVLKPEKQSPTMMTIADDYIHYHTPRALTVREMARLQSFDDSFIFQGKRTTGGDKRKSEVPQYSLVGNAVPPLLARAVAMEVLKNIK